VHRSSGAARASQHHPVVGFDHVPALEGELAGLSAAGGYQPTSKHAGRSPDRADAMIWAVSELIRPARTVRVSGL